MEIKLKLTNHFLIFFGLLLSIHTNADLVDKIVFKKIEVENTFKPEISNRSLNQKNPLKDINIDVSKIIFLSEDKIINTNFNKLNKETQNRIAVQNEDSGFWNPVNLFKYFHVYLNEKYDNGMVLSYYNIADQRNPGSFDGKEMVENVVNIGAFHETWMGIVPTFLWSEKKDSKSNTPKDYLSNAIPDYNYNIKWECDVLKKDKAIIKYTMPEDEDKVTEEVIMTITKNKYKKSTDAFRAFNAIYDKN